MLTLKEAAELLGMTPDTLRQAIARGVLKATRTPGPPNRALWIVEQEEVDRYRAEHRRKAPEPVSTAEAIEGMERVGKAIRESDIGISVPADRPRS